MAQRDGPYPDFEDQLDECKRYTRRLGDAIRELEGRVRRVKGKDPLHLEERFDRASTELSASRTSVARLEADLKECGAELAKVTERRDILQNDWDHECRERTIAMERLAEVTAERDELKARLEVALAGSGDSCENSGLIACRADLSRARKEKNNALDEMLGARRMSEQWDAQCRSLERQLAAMAAERDEWKRRRDVTAAQRDLVRNATTHTAELARALRVHAELLKADDAARRGEKPA